MLGLIDLLELCLASSMLRQRLLSPTALCGFARVIWEQLRPTTFLQLFVLLREETAQLLQEAYGFDPITCLSYAVDPDRVIGQHFTTAVEYDRPATVEWLLDIESLFVTKYCSDDAESPACTELTPGVVVWLQRVGSLMTVACNANAYKVLGFLAEIQIHLDENVWSNGWVSIMVEAGLIGIVAPYLGRSIIHNPLESPKNCEPLLNAACRSKSPVAAKVVIEYIVQQVTRLFGERAAQRVVQKAMKILHPPTIEQFIAYNCEVSNWLVNTYTIFDDDLDGDQKAA